MNRQCSLIWAQDKHGLIGNGDALPWHLPADMAWFRKHTLGKNILMGRKTFDSIGRPLPKRKNLVLSQQQDLKLPGCTLVHSLEEALQQYSDQELMIIGGAQIYKLALTWAQRLFITDIDAVFEGDVYFPDFAADNWQEVSRQDHQADEKNPYPYAFRILERR